MCTVFSILNLKPFSAYLLAPFSNFITFFLSDCFSILGVIFFRNGAGACIIRLFRVLFWVLKQ